MKRVTFITAGVASSLLLLSALSIEAQQTNKLLGGAVLPGVQVFVTYTKAKVTEVESPCLSCGQPTVNFSLKVGAAAAKLYLYTSSVEDVQATYAALLTALSNNSQIDVTVGIPNLPTGGARVQGGVIPANTSESRIQVYSVAIEKEPLATAPSPAPLPSPTYSEYDYVQAVVVRENGYLYVSPSGNFPAGTGGCRKSEFGRSQYDVGDERTKAMMTEALASMLGKIKVGFWLGGCDNESGYPIIQAITVWSQ